eukprot:g1597.t1
MDFLLGAVARTANAHVAREQAPSAELRVLDVLSCQLCGISYLKKGERAAPLKKLGFHLLVEKTSWFVAIKVEKPQSAANRGMFERELPRENPPLGFVVFRGTASVRDVVTDLAAAPTIPVGTFPLPGPGGIDVSDDVKMMSKMGYFPKTQFHSGMFLNVLQNQKLRYALEQCGLIKNKVISDSELWLPDKGHRIRAFVYASDPIPRLDRQENNVYGGTSWKLRGH